MAYWIVVTFDDPEEAGKVRETIGQMQKGGNINLDDSAVVVKDAEGKVHLQNEMDRGVKVGAVGGGLLGLLIGSIFFPIGGLLIGALLGGLIGKGANLGVDKKFIKDVEEELQPNTSALFLVVRDADPGPTITALDEFKGHIYHTSLPEEAEESLRKAMESK